MIELSELGTKLPTSIARHGIGTPYREIGSLHRQRVKPVTKIVIGAAQSASCSKYRSYGESTSQQIYIPNAGGVTDDGTEKDAVFTWQ